jgi:hypothetical protein
MGNCKSILEEDDDDRIIRIKNKQKARELKEFQSQLRKQKCHSQLDMFGKPDLRPREMRMAMDRVYDA